MKQIVTAIGFNLSYFYSLFNFKNTNILQVVHTSIVVYNMIVGMMTVSLHTTQQTSPSNAASIHSNTNNITMYNSISIRFPVIHIHKYSDFKFLSMQETARGK